VTVIGELPPGSFGADGRVYQTDGVGTDGADGGGAVDGADGAGGGGIGGTQRADAADGTAGAVAVGALTAGTGGAVVEMRGGGVPGVGIDMTAAALGSETSTDVPQPWTLSIVSVPPRRVTIPCATARPRPRVFEPFVVWNGSSA
jgi:hypothetical protein